MKKRVCTWKKRLDKPPGFYRLGISVGQIASAISKKGWLSVIQIVGLVGGAIPPTNAMRYSRMEGGRIRPSKNAAVEVQIASGRKVIVRLQINQMMRSGALERRGSRGSFEYRLKDER